MGSKKSGAQTSMPLTFFVFFLPHALHPFLEGGGANAEQKSTHSGRFFVFFSACVGFSENQRKREVFLNHVGFNFLQKT